MYPCGESARARERERDKLTMTWHSPTHVGRDVAQVLDLAPLLTCMANARSAFLFCVVALTVESGVSEPATTEGDYNARTGIGITSTGGPCLEDTFFVRWLGPQGNIVKMQQATRQVPQP